MTRFWHPYALEWPLVDGNEKITMKRDMKDRGIQEPITFRMLDGGKQYLDGRNRAMIAEELGIECPEAEVKVKDEECKAYIDSKNLHRRQLTPKRRKEIILKMASQGYSRRAIAKKTKSSRTTVQKHLAQSGPPASVTGSDGKTYKTGKLIDELKTIPMSPKVGPLVAAWSKSKQLDFLSHMHETGGNIGKAFHMTENQRQSGDETGAAPGPRVHAKIPKWNQLDKLIKSVEVLPDALADCYEGKEKHCDEYRECQLALNEFRWAWDRWTNRLRLASG